MCHPSWERYYKHAPGKHKLDGYMPSLNYKTIEDKAKNQSQSLWYTASFPATKAPDTAVMPTITQVGRTSFLILAAPLTQVKVPAGGSGMTTDRAVQRRPQYMTNADVRCAARR